MLRKGMACLAIKRMVPNWARASASTVLEKAVVLEGGLVPQRASRNCIESTTIASAEAGIRRKM